MAYFTFFEQSPFFSSTVEPISIFVVLPLYYISPPMDNVSHPEALLDSVEVPDDVFFVLPASTTTIWPTGITHLYLCEEIIAPPVMPISFIIRVFLIISYILSAT